MKSLVPMGAKVSLMNNYVTHPYCIITIILSYSYKYFQQNWFQWPSLMLWGTSSIPPARPFWCDDIDSSTGTPSNGNTNHCWMRVLKNIWRIFLCHVLFTKQHKQKATCSTSITITITCFVRSQKSWDSIAAAKHFWSSRCPLKKA